MAQTEEHTETGGTEVRPLPMRRRSRLGLATQEVVAKYWAAFLAALPLAGVIGGLLGKTFSAGVAEGTTLALVQRLSEQSTALDHRITVEEAVRLESDRRHDAAIAKQEGTSEAIQTALRFIGSDIADIKRALETRRAGAAK